MGGTECIASAGERVRDGMNGIGLRPLCSPEAGTLAADRLLGSQRATCTYAPCLETRPPALESPVWTVFGTVVSRGSRVSCGWCGWFVLPASSRAGSRPSLLFVFGGLGSAAVASLLACAHSDSKPRTASARVRVFRDPALTLSQRAFGQLNLMIERYHIPCLKIESADGRY